MRSSEVGSAMEQIAAGLDALSDTDVVALDDPTLRMPWNGPTTQAG